MTTHSDHVTFESSTALRAASARTAPYGVRVCRRSDGRLDLVSEGSTVWGPVRAALLAHGSVAQVVVRQHKGRLVAVVLARAAEPVRRRPTTAIGLALDRLARLAPQRALHLGIGDMDLSAALSAHCADYELADPSVDKICEVLAGRPDLRQRVRLSAAHPTVDVFAAKKPYDVVLLDAAAPSLSSLDVPGTAVGLLRLVRGDGVVCVVNLRDPRLERLANLLRTGRAESTPDAAGWSPPAVQRALAGRAPWADWQAHVLLGPLPAAATYHLLLRPARTTTKTPLLRWGRDLHSPAQLDRLLSGRGVARLRLIGLPAAGVADVVPPGWAMCGRARTAVDWWDIDTVAAEHGYRTTPLASLTEAEELFDVLVERQDSSGRPSPGGGLAARLRAWLAVRLPGLAAEVDLVVLGEDEDPETMP